MKIFLQIKSPYKIYKMISFTLYAISHLMTSVTCILNSELAIYINAPCLIFHKKWALKIKTNSKSLKINQLRFCQTIQGRSNPLWVLKFQRAKVLAQVGWPFKYLFGLLSKNYLFGIVCAQRKPNISQKRAQLQFCSVDLEIQTALHEQQKNL